MSDRRRLGAGYLVVQAAAVVVWWSGLVLSPRVRGWFELDGERHEVLSAFVIGDLVVLFAGSVTAAVALVRQVRWAAWCVAWVAGGCAYATLLLAAWVTLGGHGAVGLVPMTAATMVTSAIAVQQAGASGS